MYIREATQEDIPQILNVLKASLGETSSRKTEEVWRFKHLDNPFGRSLVLVALEEGEIVGVRAFMRWNWQKGNEIFSAFRAVDTATHPEHQGKGIFKKLTLKALDIAKDNGAHFVFNTPNDQSRPGYLKMGWEEVAKLEVGIRLANPLNWKRSVENKEYRVVRECSEKRMEKLLEQMNKQLVNNGKLFTPKSPEFLKWRYEDNPLQRYMVRATEDFYIAGYIKSHSHYRELRVVEIIFTSAATGKMVKKHIKTWAKEFAVQFISFAPRYRFNFKMGFAGKFGPVFTLRNINLPEQKNQDLLVLDNWGYSLGDLELF